MLPFTKPVSGTRKVPAHLLIPRPSKDLWPTSSASKPAYISFCTVTRSDGFIVLPRHEISVAAVEYVGFTTEAATRILHRWEGRPDPNDNPDHLIDYALAEIRTLSAELSDAGLLARWGMNEEFQRPFVDPTYSEVKQTESLQYWTRNTVSCRYRTLLALLERYRNAAPEEEHPSTSMLDLGLIPHDRSFPPKHVALVSSSGPLLPGHVRLYQGKAQCDFVPDIIDDEDGRVNLWATDTPGDFSECSHGSYWTPQKKCAESFRTWAAARDPQAATFIIEIRVPLQFLDSLTRKQLWFSPDWKTYVWYCRAWKHVPSRFKSFADADVVEGYICKAAGIRRVEKDQVQDKLDESDVLRVGSANNMARQIVFMNTAVIDALSDAVWGKVHISMHEPKLLVGEAVT